MIASEAEEQLRARARAWTGVEIDGAKAAETLRDIARTEGIDFATALLHERLLSNSANAELLARANRARDLQAISTDVIGIVPGAFHREHRHTGADGQRVLQIARELGCRAEVIPTGSLGTLSANAETIRAWLARHRGERVTLLSLSKGSADVKYALSTRGEDGFSEVAAWVSFSGLVQGTPLIRWLRRRPLRWWSVRLLLWWRGLSSVPLLELQHGAGTPLASWPPLPRALRVVHVYGFPLQQHLHHRWAPKGHARLCPLGPNDGGGVLLADLLNLPGVVCPIWGADHYLTPPWDAHSMLRGIVAASAEPREPSASAHASSARAPGFTE